MNTKQAISERLCDVYVAEYDQGFVKGSTIERINDRNGFFTHPILSPNGGMIAFWGICDGAWDVWIIDLKTGQNKPVTNNGMVCYRPAWHSSGEKLAFNNKGTGDHYIWTVNIDGTNLQQITFSDSKHETVYDHGAFWTKNGDSILFHSNRCGDWGLWLINVKNKFLK